MDIFVDLPTGTAKLEIHVTPKNEKTTFHPKETFKRLHGGIKNSPHFGRNGVEIVYDPL
ncbi:hypothetical protein TREPR_2234 [Treponema primitia ZAS-2]|uniref:Uncharacterized protein n=1 Tax=Treponema primitia (strain ATCC BAA-887 / DSM 12427 / ZAS-2) TaxID=545694 RepID=F5YIG9_TREPZ|nr:hypothetical protein TREPR_2234 [Treponema primitia ZAS-2]